MCGQEFVVCTRDYGSFLKCFIPFITRNRNMLRFVYRITVLFGIGASDGYYHLECSVCELNYRVQIVYTSLSGDFLFFS